MRNRLLYIFTIVITTMISVAVAAAISLLLTDSQSAEMSSNFLYFAYGSNLLAHRIHINNPSAVRAGIGRLNDYQLDFITYSKRWRGASATIVKKAGSHVWGALWEINIKHMESLDRQEGVKDKIYFPMDIEVVLLGGGTAKCRVYQQTATPTDNISKIEDLPDERKPSAIYLATMLKGAKESGLPDDYIEFLKRIPHNGYDGAVDIGIDLNIIK